MMIAVNLANNSTVFDLTHFVVQDSAVRGVDFAMADPRGAEVPAKRFLSCPHNLVSI